MAAEKGSENDNDPLDQYGVLLHLPAFKNEELRGYLSSSDGEGQSNSQ